MCLMLSTEIKQLKIMIIMVLPLSVVSFIVHCGNKYSVLGVSMLYAYLLFVGHLPLYFLVTLL